MRNEPPQDRPGQRRRPPRRTQPSPKALAETVDTIILMLPDTPEVQDVLFGENGLSYGLKAGKLVIGPWYVLPDEFLVSGEALIRNLRLGREIARNFGVEPSNAGFVCDLFGHNSQMPQILAGFDIHGGLIWRGLNHLQTRHVRWRGADGTEIAAYRFPSGGYCDYTFKVRHALAGLHMQAQAVQDVGGAVERIHIFQCEQGSHAALPR